MIHKFLFVNKTVYLSSMKLEDERPGTSVIELLVPIQVYWNITELLNRANFLLSSGEQMAEIQAIYKKIFKEAAPYAVFENDRLWLFRSAGLASAASSQGSQGSGQGGAGSKEKEKEKDSKEP